MNDYFIYSIGFLAQLLFSFRQLVQWISSEKEKISIEKSIFLGRNQIVNNFCITISGTLNTNENKIITWELKRNN